MSWTSRTRCGLSLAAGGDLLALASDSTGPERQAGNLATLRTNSLTFSFIFDSFV